MTLKFKYENYEVGKKEHVEVVTFEKFYSLTANYPNKGDNIIYNGELYLVILRTWDYENEVIYYKLGRV